MAQQALKHAFTYEVVGVCPRCQTVNNNLILGSVQACSGCGTPSLVSVRVPYQIQNTLYAADDGVASVTVHGTKTGGAAVALDAKSGGGAGAGGLGPRSPPANSGELSSKKPRVPEAFNVRDTTKEDEAGAKYCKPCKVDGNNRRSCTGLFNVDVSSLTIARLFKFRDPQRYSKFAENALAAALDEVRDTPEWQAAESGFGATYTDPWTGQSHLWPCYVHNCGNKSTHRVGAHLWYAGAWGEPMLLPCCGRHNSVMYTYQIHPLYWDAVVQAPHCDIDKPKYKDPPAPPEFDGSAPPKHK